MALIRTGDYGKIVVDGVEYVESYPKWVIPILRTVKFTQKTLWVLGIAVHDPIFGECTPDGNCCCKHVGRFSFLRVNDKII